MAAPGYNCPFSAVAGSTDYVMTCTEVRAANTDAGCPFYDAKNEHCALAEFAHREARIGQVDPSYT